MISLFYSWQLDENEYLNTESIRTSLNEAASILNSELQEAQIIIDEATRGQAGSPEIPSTIFSKILNSDIFVCDISTVSEYTTTDGRPKKTPNPNVLLELGFAIAVLGWERILMLFNKNIGDFESGFPFDLNKRKIISFKIEKDYEKADGSELSKILEQQIRQILTVNPQKAISVQELSESNIKRNRDIDALRMIFSTINIPILDNFIFHAPKSIDTRILHFYESFNGIYMSSSFHLYNSELSSIIDEFHNLWTKTLSYGDYYRGDGNIHLFGINFNEKENIKYVELEEFFRLFILKKDELFLYIKNNYLEVDLNETSRLAKQEYVEFNKIK